MSSKFEIQANEVPAIRIADAVGRGVNNDILFVVGGGLGDRICAEPTLRFAMDRFDAKFSLRCDTPELFEHLGFDLIYSKDPPPVGKHLQLPTYALGLGNQFFNANLMHGVDFASISALRCQLPNSYRQPQLFPQHPKDPEVCNICTAGRVVLHLGRTWPSRTLPSSWWRQLVSDLSYLNFIPVLIGNNCKDIELPMFEEVEDFREKLSLQEFLWVSKHCWRMVTNDSSPLHVASTGDSDIAVIATSRNPDFLIHQRKAGETRAFYKKPMWESFHRLPNTLDDWPANEVPSGHVIDDFMPEPWDVAQWITR